MNRSFLKENKNWGGSITRRSGAKAIRYRLCHQSGIINLINIINGSIRNTISLEQFQKLCHHFNIGYVVAEPLTLENAYLAGFFMLMKRFTLV